MGLMYRVMGTYFTLHDFFALINVEMHLKACCNLSDLICEIYYTLKDFGRPIIN